MLNLFCSSAYSILPLKRNKSNIRNKRNVVGAVGWPVERVPMYGRMAVALGMKPSVSRTDGHHSAGMRPFAPPPTGRLASLGT